MRLSQLKIVGFKSFANKLDVKFSSGITAIVGPNGCGKSNIVDAIRWVLGEQRATVLRGGRMEDVIFNGTSRQKPLGMAEVSLTIDNDKQLLPIEYSEVTITRRLFRSGESEYLINKVPCRLKDITDLLLDTGMGTHAYSMIEQGHVDTIVNGSPLERRNLIEEAAGINKYKTRRRLAERKLESTEHDLVRIADILEEVEKQAGSLRRQVWKCERYKRLNQERQELDVALAHHEYLALRQETEPIREQLQMLTEEKEGLTTKIATAEARIEKRQLELTEKEQMLNARQQDVNTCDQKIHALNEQVLVSRTRRNGLEHRMGSAREEIQSVRTELENINTQRTEAERDGKALAEELEKAQVTFRKREEEAKTFAKTLTERKEQARVMQRRRLEIVQRQTEKRGERASMENRLNELQERQNQAAQTKERLDTELAELTDRAKEAGKRLDAATKTFEENMALKASIEVELAAGQNQRDETLERKSELDAQRAVKVREHALLTQMRQQYEGYGQGVRALLADGPSIDGLHGTIAENVTVEAAYAPAIEAYLGEALQYVVSSTTAAACEGIGYLHEHGQGLVSFLLLDRLSANGQAPAAPPADPDIIGPALDFVQASEPFEPAVRYLLSHVILVRHLESALRLADRFNDGNDWRLLTPAGEVIDPAGVITAGAAENGDTSLLSRAARIESLEKEIGQITEELSALEEELSALASRLNTLIERRKATEQALAEQQIAKQQAEQTAGQFAFQQRQLQEQQQRQLQDHAGLAAMIEETKNLIESLKKTLVQLDQERQEMDDTDRETNEDLDQLEAEGQRLTHAAQEARVAMISLESRGNELRTTGEHLEQYGRRLATTQQQRQQEIAHATNEIEALKKKLEEGEAQLKTLYEERRNKELARDAVATEYRAIQDDIKTLQADVQETRKAFGLVQEQIHAAELHEAKLFERGNEIRRQLIHQHDVDPEQATEPPAVADMEVFDPEAAQGIAQDIQRKIDELGPINLAAIDEYNAIKERLDFLTQQRDDLIEAKTNLEKTIVKMNRAARARFLDTFEEVRQNFTRTFETLFEGGEANLKLEEGDPLEVGIEIMARPRGKRLQSIALLSGGETALTAIALLFAIYLVKPSPFCVFDEVDAPLDDANIKRFATALQHFAQDSQFLIVTHNKRTMESANYLYGVTMEEPGLSKIVSVRLEGGEDTDTVEAGTNGTQGHSMEERVGE